MGHKHQKPDVEHILFSELLARDAGGATGAEPRARSDDASHRTFELTIELPRRSTTWPWMWHDLDD